MNRRQKDERKGEQASVALAQTGRNKASKGGWAEYPLGTKGGIFRNWPKYSRGLAAPALPHQHLQPRYKSNAKLCQINADLLTFISCCRCGITSDLHSFKKNA